MTPRGPHYKLNQGEENDITKEDLVNGTTIISAAAAVTILQDCGANIQYAGHKLTKNFCSTNV